MKFSLSKKPATPALYPHALHVYRDWAYILGICSLLLVVVIVFHVMIFLTLNSNDLPEDTSSVSTVKTINRTELQNALTTFQNRSSQFDAMRKTTPVLVDPSR